MAKLRWIPITTKFLPFEVDVRLRRGTVGSENGSVKISGEGEKVKEMSSLDRTLI